MPKFEIRSTAGRTLQFVAGELFGNVFLVVAGREGEVNAEGILKRISDAFPAFRHGVSPVMWVTRSEDSVTGDRLLRMLTVGDTIEWTMPYSWVHQSDYVRDAVEQYEVLLAAPG
jgi:hypothetical protein